jgi:hypothetical protein
MALSLLTTLAAAVIFQPALMATQRRSASLDEMGSPQNAKLRQKGNSHPEERLLT